MALISCPECGKEISDKAPSCIHCGCPLKTASPITVTATITAQDKAIKTISAVLVLIAFAMTVYANHFQNQEVIYMVRILSGGILAYLAMIVCIIAAAIYVFPSKKGIKSSCIVTTIYSLTALLCQVFMLSRFSFAIPLCLLTIVVILAYAIIYWISASGSFPNICTSTPQQVGNTTFKQIPPSNQFEKGCRDWIAKQFNRC